MSLLLLQTVIRFFLSIYCLDAKVDLVFITFIFTHNVKILGRGNVSELCLTNQSSRTLLRFILHSYPIYVTNFIFPIIINEHSAL